MSESEEPLVPVIRVEAQGRYVIGFPLLIAVGLCNESVDTDYLNLPDLGLLMPIDSLALVLHPEGGGPALVIGPSFETEEQHLFRTHLMVGECTRSVIDISTLGQPLEPGRYRLESRLFSHSGVYRASPGVAVELVEPSAPERAQAQRLRRLGLPGQALDTGSWLPFLTHNGSSVPPPAGLGAIASYQLALHLALHGAAYGPVALDLLPLDHFAAVQGPVLAPEVAVLQYELLAARTSDTRRDAARALILRQWPALGRRLDQVDRGSGLLTTLRNGYGAGSNRKPPAASSPVR